MNYEQQLKEIENPKGCGNDIIQVLGKGWRICRNGILCDTCKAIQQAKKETLLICAKDKLDHFEKLKKALSTLDNITNDVGNYFTDVFDGYYEYEMHREKQLLKIHTFLSNKNGEVFEWFEKAYDHCEEEISQLQKVIKKLEEMK